MSTYSSAGNYFVATGTSNTSASVYVDSVYVEYVPVEKPKKQETPEQWLRSRVKEICEIVDF